MLPKVQTLYTIREMTTDGHAPILFHCSDGNNYYCKYRIHYNKEEINCLAYEVLASKLLQHLEIPTPKIALVEVSIDSLDKKLIIKNRRVREGMVLFGSQEISPSRILDDLSEVKSKKYFNRIVNPTDLVKIAIFDLWINNVDRGRELTPGFNYNLLIRSFLLKEEIIAFDHAFAFGGVNPLGNFFPSAPLIREDRLYQTPYYRSVVRYLKQSEFDSIIENFVSLLRYDYSDVVIQTITLVSQYWELIPNIDAKIISFLAAENRINEIERIIKQSKS